MFSAPLFKLVSELHLLIFILFDVPTGYEPFL